MSVYLCPSFSPPLSSPLYCPHFPQGSGKTLAFGIPILMHILKKNLSMSDNVLGVGEDKVEDKGLTDSEREDEGVGRQEESLGYSATDFITEEEPPKAKRVKRCAGSLPQHGLVALILAPTRELAIQIHSHLCAVAKHTSIKVQYHSRSTIKDISKVNKPPN